MKQLLLFGAALMLSATMHAQARLVPEVRKVTIFSDGAQVYRQQTVALRSGQQTVSFTGLSPFIDMKSLQVKAKGKVTVMGVSRRIVRPDSLMLVGKVRTAEQQLRQAAQKVEELQARRNALNAQLEMVKTNCSTANRTVATPLEAVRQLNQYYYEETMAINKKLIALADEEQAARNLMDNRQQQLDSVAGIKMRTLSVLDVRVDASQAASADFTLAYFVKGAGWNPSYDIRSGSTSEPLQLTYKATITQRTHEDWRNVPVTLSTANPNRSNVAPNLKTYWLDYGLAAPSYNTGNDINTVAGIVTDENNDPLPGASIRVAGTTIGTVSDIDGRYSLTLPNGRKTIEAAYVGMRTQQLTAHGGTLDIRMQNDDQALDEVIVVGYGQGSKAADVAAEAAPRPKAARQVARKVADDNAMDVSTTAAKFGYEFEIRHALTILSGDKPVNCEIGQYELPAQYAYRVIPKVDKDAFLVADATGWDGLNLTEGEATVFFDNSYVGKTILDPTQQSDTLHLALGRDNGIHVERKLVKNNTVKKLLGSSQVQTMDWEIGIRNSRTEPVTLKVYDQIPVSRNSDIVVTVQQLSGGQLDKDTGEVTWTLSLAPGETQKLQLGYQVKSPKGRRLNVE